MGFPPTEWSGLQSQVFIRLLYVERPDRLAIDSQEWRGVYHSQFSLPINVYPEGGTLSRVQSKPAQLQKLNSNTQTPEKNSNILFHSNNNKPNLCA